MAQLRDDHGNATVLGLAVAAIVLAFGLIGVVQVQATLASHSVQSAADLSALAGAQTLGDPCVAAQHMAQANNVSMLACESAGGDVAVEVQAPAPSLVVVLFERFGLPVGNVRATAKAGPPGV